MPPGAPPAAAAERGHASTTLSIETVKRRASGTYLSTEYGPFALVVAGPVTVEHESTGQTWTLAECAGWCDIDGVSPGAYRVTVAFGGRRRSIVTGVPVRANRQTYLRVELTEGEREVVAASERLVPLTGVGPDLGTFVTVPEPGDVPWRLTESCQPPAADTELADGTSWLGLGLQRLGLAATKQQRRPLVASATGSEVWGDLRRWWGAIVGTAATPDGQTIAGAPVIAELLDAEGHNFTSVPIVQTRSTANGCFGIHGLWPGRYRLVVDYPPFAHVAELDVRSARVGEATMSDVALQAMASQFDRPDGRLSIHSAWFGRISSVDALLRVVRSRDAESRAGRAPELLAADVSGVAVWRYNPGHWKHVYRVPGVSVTYEHDVAGERWQAVTDADGYYRLRMPTGVYRMTIDHPPFLPLRARVLVTMEGHAVLEGFQDPEAGASGVYVPGAMLRSGLMASINLALVLPVSGTTSSDANMVSVQGRPVPYIAPPLSVEFASGGPTESLWTTPLSHHSQAGRTIQAFHALTPGIVYTESVGTLAQFTAAGQRRLANRLTIDGISADLGIDVRGYGIGEAGSGALPAFATTGGTQTLVPVDAIETVDVHASNVSSQLARTPGAQTTIVTRAGPDRFSGLAFADVRPDGLSATDFFDNATGTRRARQFSGSGLSLGGPLLVRRANYWATYEQQRIDRSVTMTVPVPSLAVRDAAPAHLRPLLDAFPRPNGPLLGEGQSWFPEGPSEIFGPGLAELTTSIPSTSALSVLSTRVDGSLSGRHRLFARASHGRSKGDALAEIRQLPAISFDSVESTSTTSVTAGATSIGRSAVHDLRLNATVHHGDLTASTASYGGAGSLPNGVLVPPGVTEAAAWARLWMFPGGSGSVASGRFGAASQHQLQIVDTWTFLRGRHEWRIGLDYRRVTTGTDPPDHRYTYRFEDVASFLNGTATAVTIDRFEAARVRFQTWSAFVQDDFRVSSRLSLHYGLRYGIKPAPRNLTAVQPSLIQFESLSDVPNVRLRSADAPLWNTSWTDVAPRVAATIGLRDTPGREAVLRIGWSLVFDELTRPGASAFGRGFPYQSQRTIPHPSTFPVSAADLTPSHPPSFKEADYAQLYSFPSDLRSPRTQQWQVGVEQAFGGQQRVALAYVGAAGRALPYWYAHYVNDPNHVVYVFEDGASSDYHALLADYTRRLVRGLQARVAYTWSHAIDTDSGESRDPNPPPGMSPIAANRASSDFDRRHVLHASFSLQLPARPSSKVLRALFADWRLDAVGIVQSGAPVSINVTQGLGSRGVYTVRPDVNPGVSMWLDDPTSPTGRRINEAAFLLPKTSGHGDLGRNTLRSSPLRQVDVALVRAVRLGGKTVVRVRVDIFNVLNTTSFGPPTSALFSQPFGVPQQSYADALGAGTLSLGGLPPLHQAGGPRAIQLGVGFGW